jgi:sugar lactone lactonase YvrE
MIKYCSYIFLFGALSVTSAQEKVEIINNSLITFTISEKDLLPENIAHNPLDESFFVGSTRKGKIVKVFKDGTHEDFINSKKVGLFMVIGMKVDIENKWLWVCSSGGDNLVGYNRKDEIEGRPAGIFKFNLDSGEMIKKYVLDAPGEVHFFNDLVKDESGNIYVTHMFKEPGIYTIQKETDELELFLSPENLRYPNGITLSEDNKYLFVAHSDGVGRIQIKNKEWINIEPSDGIQVSGKYSMDGMYYYKTSFIGIQQSVNTVRQFFLNKEQTQITGSKALEVNHPMMDNPTTGTIINDDFYYVANAQFDSFNEDGSLFPMEKLYEVCILKLKLDSNR